MISWKYSFKQLNEEYDLSNRKKQALDKLYETGKISQATRDSFDNDIKAALTEIEKKQKDLLVNMQVKSQELLDQIATLEMLLANFEIQHVVGDIEDDAYQREINLMATSLEGAKNELGLIKQAMNQLCPETILEVPSAPEHFDTPLITDIPVVDAIPECSQSESIPVITATAEATQEVAPEQNIPAENAMVEEAPGEISQIPTEPQVEVITEPQKPEITEPSINEPAINMEATANPATSEPIEQTAIGIAPVVFEAVSETTPVEQVPVIESVIAEEVSSEAHPLEAPLPVHTDTIVTPTIEAENKEENAKAEETTQETSSS